MTQEWMLGPQWVSTGDHSALQATLSAAARAWAELELLTVGLDLRPGALVFLTPEEVPRAFADARGQGLALTPVAPNRYAVHRPERTSEWLEAWPDDRRVGSLLGYPECCREHFARTWSQGRTETFEDTAGGYWELNLGLRWLGIRAVAHLPCSGRCQESLHLATAALSVGHDCGVDVAALEDALRLPLRYSRESGVGIVDAGKFRLVVGAEPEPPVWADNGFRSRSAMLIAHAAILDAVGTVNSALDLGCGDGELLSRMVGGRDLADLGSFVGVEADESRASRGRRRHPELDITTGRIENVVPRWSWSGPADVALLMPGRLVEMSPEDAGEVRRKLPSLGQRLVVYTYDDKPLSSLAAAAGIELIGPISAVGGSQVADGRI